MSFQKEQILKQILNNEEIVSLIDEYHIDSEIVLKNLLSLYSYCLNKNNCKGCLGLSKCIQDINGCEPVLKFNGTFYTEYLPCPYLDVINNENLKKKNLITLACNLDYVDPSTLFSNASRNIVYSKMKEIYGEVMNGNNPRGIYLYGPYGTGKSYIMACFANKYAESGKRVVFAYFPDLVRKIKSSIGTPLFEVIVESLKSCDVLFLDDFGGETTTNFIRDEVLGAVFQERMENKSLTFITSNLDQDTLHSHLAETSKDIDHLKASRIEERIKTLMEFIPLNDENYRNK